MREKGNVIWPLASALWTLFLLSQFGLYGEESNIDTHCTLHVHMSNIDGECFTAWSSYMKPKRPRYIAKVGHPIQTFYDHIKFDLFHSASWFASAVWTAILLLTFCDAKGVNTFMYGNSSIILMFDLIGSKLNQHIHTQMHISITET